MSRYINAEKILPYISRLFGAMPLAILKMAETDGIEIVRSRSVSMQIFVRRRYTDTE